MERYYDVVVVGAGPSGLAAAITVKTARPKSSVLILEKKERAAKKLSASGNGRGNLSNKSCGSLDRVLSFFSKAGIAVKFDEEGRIYPYSEEAGAVADALVKRASWLGTDIFVNSEVKSAEVDSERGFRIFVSQEGAEQRLSCKYLLIATGGKSYGIYGSTGDGYRLARSLGHQVTALLPSLTAIQVKEDIKALKGVRVKGEVSLFEEGALKFREQGEIQFREDSISGICVMNLSSFMPSFAACGREGGKGKLRISVNTVPDFDSAGLISFMLSKKNSEGATAFDVLETLTKKPLAGYVLRNAGIEENRDASELTSEEILKIANGLRSLTLTPESLKGWKEAQVTKGGIKMEEVCQDTMESVFYSGLYFSGEILDYDGLCGGFNLHNAWLTGIKAGEAIAERIGTCTE